MIRDDNFSSPSGLQTYFAYVGCRTTRERNARGEGIRVYRVDAASGVWTDVQLVDGLVNPSFLAIDRAGRFLYSVHGDRSEVSAYAIDPATGRLTPIGQVSCEGRNPVHLLLDQSERFLVVANYASGTLVVLPRNADGTLACVSQSVALPGDPGPHRTQQLAAQPHHLVFDPAKQFILVPDKGVDRVFTYRFDAQAGQLLTGQPNWVTVRPGAGPRHLAFRPDARFVYVAHELDSSVGTYQYDAACGALTPIQVLPSLPDTFTGANTTAEIEVSPSGRWLFVSNRGHDSIAVFRIDQQSGRLSSVGWTLTGGRDPRFFTLDPGGRRLYAANEGSDEIVAYGFDDTTGELRREAVIANRSPVCIVFSKQEAR